MLVIARGAQQQIAHEAGRALLAQGLQAGGVGQILPPARMLQPGAVRAHDEQELRTGLPVHVRTQGQLCAVVRLERVAVNVQHHLDGRVARQPVLRQLSHARVGIVIIPEVDE